MYSLCIYFFFLSFTLSDAFFSLEDKPIFWCFKVCPLYCSPRRSDEGGPPPIYLDDSPYDFHDWVDDDPLPVHYSYHDYGHHDDHHHDVDNRDYGHHDHGHHDHGYWQFCTWPTTTTLKPTTQPHPTTTTMTTTTAMTTTTEVPTWICSVCKAKCGYPKS
ncbi:unnamed protein product [Chrysodeixis includens]|uniref:Uncharacterized protein n=1 Tax=Chrysodeixis includens TaxID=689277 RepID=A0A9P0BQP0_CHRIL|nr:unnamed protein product [Chrysodeixis includens]